jgi:hypothetical protein
MPNSALRTTSTTAERTLRNGATEACNLGPAKTSLERVRRSAALIRYLHPADAQAGAAQTGAAQTGAGTWQPGDKMSWRRP